MLARFRTLPLLVHQADLLQLAQHPVHGSQAEADADVAQLLKHALGRNRHLLMLLHDLQDANPRTGGAQALAPHLFIDRVGAVAALLVARC